ncbi:hypothetical protein PO909_029555 [Leuciscus waleckii]
MQRSRKQKQQLRFARCGKGKQSDGLAEKPSGSSTSDRKLSLGNQGGFNDSATDCATQQWLIIHVARLNELISDLVCPNCAASDLFINIDPVNHGFCSSLLLECSTCKGESGYRRSVYTSTRLQSQTRGDVAFDVNVRMVLLAHELGMGYAALREVSKVLGIPSLHLKTYQRHDKRVTVAEIERGLESLHKAREQIRQAYSDVDPELAELLREDADAVINIGVSFDGTWKKRGFTSHYGIGVCIDILTGLVIDFEVLSSYCHACVLKQSAKIEGKITVEEFNSWRETHTDCAKNFTGSSKAMEQQAAKRIWARSVSRHQLLSDGDSSAFKEVLSL